MRLLLITRQFWPSIGGAQIAMSNLAEGLCKLGAEVTVLTARWHPTWPAKYQHGPVRVLRLPQPAVRMWGTFRYMKAMRNWLCKHHSEFDLIYISMLKHEAYVALRELSEGPLPIVLRPEGAGSLGDVAWHEQARFGHAIRRVCRQATAVVAIAPLVREELIAAGFSDERIHQIPNGVPIPESVDDREQATARKELAASDPRLKLPFDAKLALYVGRLHEEKGLLDLLESWRTIARKLPAARLWIVGDGPLRRRLVAGIEEFGLGKSVVLAGSYDSTAQFFQAADLFVFPSRCELMSLALLEAMAAGKRIVASDIAGNRHLLDDGQCGLLVPTGDIVGLARSIEEQLTDVAATNHAGCAARERVQQRFSLSRMAQEHWKLFKQLTKPT